MSRGSALHGMADFWKGRPRYGYAALAALQEETWVQPPYWGGPRTYGYESGQFRRMKDELRRVPPAKRVSGE